MSDERQHGVGARDEIAPLIRLAGRRRAVPRDRSARVKSAVRDHWEREVLSRRRRRYAWTAVATAAAASLILVTSIRIRRPEPAPAPSSPGAATVESLAGASWIDGSPGPGSRGRRPLEIRDAVPAGSVVTTGEDGRLALRIAPAGSVRLDTGTRLRLLGPGALALDQGAVYLDSGPADGAAGTVIRTVETPLGTIQEVGTQFEVRLQAGSVRVRVREGSVILNHLDQVHEVPAARELTLDEHASVTIREIPTYGPDWEWVARIAAVPNLNGLSARAFLDWVARERGWRLSFASEDLARSAEGIILSGALERLTLEEALDAVLPTCGLSHRVEGGDLIIDPLAEARPPG